MAWCAGFYPLPRRLNHTFQTALGPCRISWEGESLTGFALPPVPESSDQPPPWVAIIIADVQAHLAGKLRDFSGFPYAWDRVTPFQRAVFEGALRVKPGETWSYGRLATAIGQPLSASRAVGAALGSNPWPLLVPCHRFIGADGRMTGFSAPGGINTKLRLLALEGVELFSS